MDVFEWGLSCIDGQQVRQKPGIGAEFEPLILQILAEGFDCTIGARIGPPSNGMGAELDPAALQTLAEGLRLHNGSLNRSPWNQMVGSRIWIPQSYE